MSLICTWGALNDLKVKRKLSMYIHNHLKHSACELRYWSWKKIIYDKELFSYHTARPQFCLWVVKPASVDLKYSFDLPQGNSAQYYLTTFQNINLLENSLFTHYHVTKVTEEQLLFRLTLQMHYHRLRQAWLCTKSQFMNW